MKVLINKIWKKVKLLIRYNFYYQLKYIPLKIFSNLIFKYRLNDNISKIRYKQKINPIVYQTWVSKKFNHSHYLELLKFRRINPELSFKLFNDVEMNAYVKKRWSKHKIYEIYKRCLHGPLKTDIFRYCILYDKGGYYFDIDKMCSKKLTSLHSRKASALMSFEPYYYKHEKDKKVAKFLKIKNKNICQWGIGFKKKHQILLEIINKICQNYPYFKNKIFKKYEVAGAYFTGPALFTNVVRNYLKKKIDKNICFLKTNFDNHGVFRIKGSSIRYTLLRPSWTYKKCKLVE
jgi:mannosyltransferase OCH1-like enzyme